jgi:prepilin-type processing-associated H-X9-DG protein
LLPKPKLSPDAAGEALWERAGVRGLESPRSCTYPNEKTHHRQSPLQNQPTSPGNPLKPYYPVKLPEQLRSHPEPEADLRQLQPSVIAANENLSYSYVKRKLNAASVRSDTILSADKAVRDPDISGNDSAAGGGTTSGGPTGSHDDGLNILFADGHVQFSPIAETDALQRCIDRLRLDGCDTVIKAKANVN